MLASTAGGSTGRPGPTSPSRRRCGWRRGCRGRSSASESA